MSTIRVAKNANYSVINNTVLNDPKLSWRAKGIAAYLLSKPDDWSINSQHLWKVGTEGRDAVRAAMNELEAAGYLHRRKVQDKTGKWSTESVLTETPTPENQASVFQSSVNQSSVFQAPILSTEVPNTEVLSTDHKSDQGGGEKIVATPAPNGKAKLLSDSYDLPPRQSEPPPPTVAPAPPAPGLATNQQLQRWAPKIDPRKFRGGYIPAGQGTTPVEIWYESFPVTDAATRLTAPDQDDLGACTDLAKLHKVIATFRQCDFKRKRNIRLILDWYRDGIPPQYTGDNNGTNSHSGGSNGRHDRPVAPPPTARAVFLPVDPDDPY